MKNSSKQTYIRNRRDLPDDWSIRRMGSLHCWLSSGISRPFFSSATDGIAVLRSNNVCLGKIDIGDLKRWYNPDPRGSDLATSMPQPGDLLINFVNGSRSELGKAAVYRGQPSPCIVSTNLFIFRPRQDLVLSDYLEYHLGSDFYRKWLYSIVSFSGPGSFNQSQLSSHEIPLPPIVEQRKIVQILSTWDQAIDQTRRLIEAKKQRKKALMQRLLTGKKRLKDFSAKWRCRTLEDITVVRFSGVDKKTNEGEMPVRLCNYTDVYYNECVDNSMVFMDATATQREIEQFALRKGDVLITKDSETPDDIAVPCLVADDLDNVLCGYHLSLLRPREGEVVGAFLSRVLRLDTVNAQFVSSANGVTRFGLPVEAVRGIKIRMPDTTEQSAIAEVLLAADKEILAHERQLAALEQQKRGLMQQLLTGAIRVNT